VKCPRTVEGKEIMMNDTIKKVPSKQTQLIKWAGLKNASGSPTSDLMR